MTDSEFRALKSQIEGEPFRKGKLRVIGIANDQNWFTTDQVSELVALLHHGSARVEVATTLDGRTVDQGDFDEVLSVFDMDVHSEEVRREARPLTLANGPATHCSRVSAVYRFHRSAPLPARATVDAFLDISWKVVGYHLFTLTLAFVLALPIGWHRKRSTHAPGLRTFPLVSLASAGYVLLGRSVLEGQAPAEARILQGLITGIGFVGGGVIVHQGIEVEGTTTAVSVWNTAAIGAAVAYGRIEIALVLSLANFGILLVLTPATRSMRHDDNEPPLVGESRQKEDELDG
jgi:putative Mg2+ transporter-C (MgtC) family protein